MGRARLTRIDAVNEMAAAVDLFRAEVMATIECLDMDIRRALDWVHEDCRDHWKHEVRRGWDRITQARLQLQQARTSRRVGDHEPACPDEKKALARAQRRLETAQEKVEAVKKAARAVDEAVHDYRGARTPMAAWLEADAIKAIAALRRMMENLEAYVAMEGPSGAAATPVVGAARTESPKSDAATRGNGDAGTEAAGVRGAEYSVLGATDPAPPEVGTTKPEGDAA